MGLLIVQTIKTCAIWPKESLVKITYACANPHVNILFWFHEHEYETKSACRVMADLLSGDTDHTFNTMQKERVDCSWFLSFNTKSIVSRHTRLLPHHLPSAEWYCYFECDAVFLL